MTDFNFSPSIKTALDLIRTLNQIFPNSQTVVVGGAVRDLLLGIESHDVDLATNIDFAALTAAGFVLTDITKNTVHAQPVSIIHFNDVAFEIAKFRSDVSGVIGRKNNVCVEVSTFAEDALRRDITINAIALGVNSNGETVIIDPVLGVDDLNSQIVRCVGDASVRFAEDATRILRVFRFAARFKFAIAERTLEAAFNSRHFLQDRELISPESISREFVKAASEPETLYNFISTLFQEGLLGLIIPEFQTLLGLRHDPQHHPEGDGFVLAHVLLSVLESDSSDPATNLAILFHDIGKGVTGALKENRFMSFHGHEEAGVPITKGILDRLRFHDLTHDEKEGILFCVRNHMHIHNLLQLRLSKRAKLVHSPHWNMLKAVGRADAASRGITLFDPAEFDEIIASAEASVAKVAVTDEVLRLKIKEHICGNRLMEWFPDLLKEDPKKFRALLETARADIVDAINSDLPLTESLVKFHCARILFRLTNEGF